MGTEKFEVLERERLDNALDNAIWTDATPIGNNKLYKMILEAYAPDGTRHVFKARVLRNFHPGQCSATIEHWSGTAWELVHQIPWPLLNVVREDVSGLGEFTYEEAKVMRKDLRELLLVAELVTDTIFNSHVTESTFTG